MFAFKKSPKKCNNVKQEILSANDNFFKEFIDVSGESLNKLVSDWLVGMMHQEYP